MSNLEIKIDNQKIVVPFIAILTLIAVGCVLNVAKSVVQPLLIAWLLSYILGPLVNFMSRLRVPTPLSTAFVVIILLFVCYQSALFLSGRVNAFIEVYPRYQTQFEFIAEGFTRRWNLQPLPFDQVNWGEKLSASLVSLSGQTLGFFSNLVMVFIFLIFLLLGKPYSRYKVQKALSPEKAVAVHHILSAIATQIGRYLSTLFLISLITGVLVWGALHLIGVDFAVTWGAMAFILNFIPTVGSIVATVPPVLVSIVQFYPQPFYPVLTLLVLLAIQFTIGNVVAPKILGDQLNLSPVVVLLSLVFWGWLWGVVGALLSVPIASAIKIVCENIEPLRPISILMGSSKRYAAEFSQQ